MILSLTLTTVVSIPTNNTACLCYNPFLGAAQQFFGEPELSCHRTGSCFVHCDQPCSDKEEYSGLLEGICSSTRACSTTATPSTTTTTRSPISGQSICLCKTPPSSCTVCEVECLADCHDITREGEGRCFSKAACNKDLLFEVERKLFDQKNF